MADKSNQHFVPQYYFRYFSKDGKSIGLVVRANGTVVQTGSIRKQAAKNRFYGDNELEESISKMEGIFARVTTKVRDDKGFSGITKEGEDIFLQNLVFQRERTLASRKNHQKHNSKFSEMMKTIALGRVKRDHGVEVDANDLAIDFDEKIMQMNRMIESIKMAFVLDDLKRVVLLNRTKRPLFFGDAPVVFFNPAAKRIRDRGVLGLNRVGLVVSFPISPKISILLYDCEIYKVKKLKGETVKLLNYRDVDCLNKLQLHNASDAFYFGENTDCEYAYQLWKEERKELVAFRGEVNEAPGFYETGEAIGGITHFHEPQIPYSPDLSFLEFKVFKEREYDLSGRRNIG